MARGNEAAAVGSIAGEATNGSGGAPGPLETLCRLAAEAELADQLVSGIDQRRLEARRRRERLERCLGTMEEVDRIENAALLRAEAAALESRLIRLRAAASLTKAFMQLRSAELGDLIAEGRDPPRPDELEGEPRASDGA